MQTHNLPTTRFRYERQQHPAQPSRFLTLIDNATVSEEVSFHSFFFFSCCFVCFLWNVILGAVKNKWTFCVLKNHLVVATFLSLWTGALSPIFHLIYGQQILLYGSETLSPQQYLTETYLMCRHSARWLTHHWVCPHLILDSVKAKSQL